MDCLQVWTVGSIVPLYGSGCIMCEHGEFWELSSCVDKWPWVGRSRGGQHAAPYTVGLTL
jgi:hypothetical protein